VYIGKAKGGSDGYVPILPALAQELRTHLGGRRHGYVFESNRFDKYTPRYVQRLIKDAAQRAVRSEDRLGGLAVTKPGSPQAVSCPRRMSSCAAPVIVNNACRATYIAQGWREQ
jgi:hypothetical protein